MFAKRVAQCVKQDARNVGGIVPRGVTLPAVRWMHTVRAAARGAQAPARWRPNDKATAIRAPWNQRGNAE